jgi:replication-associated recombination protein RarA
MKNQIILSGKAGSGKTFIAETIANMFISEYVLRINASCSTLVGISREIQNKEHALIIFDECVNSKHIFQINSLKALNPCTQVIYLTQDASIKNLNGFTIIECQYQK